MAAQAKLAHDKALKNLPRQEHLWHVVDSSSQMTKSSHSTPAYLAFNRSSSTTVFACVFVCIRIHMCGWRSEVDVSS